LASKWLDRAGWRLDTSRVKLRPGLRSLAALLTWIGLGVLTSVPPSLAEERAAFVFSEPGKGITTAGTDGFQFTPLVDVVVTSLGYYDRDNDGLENVHPVALFHARTGQQLAFVRVTNDSIRRGNFRFDPIRPILLRAGEPYLLAGFTPGNSDPPADTPEDLLIAPQIGYQGYLFDFGESFSRPTRTDLFSERTFFGPNFQFHPGPELLSRHP
jgi:hypothetical protein